ncbi:MAG: nuclear transport factor 2 family protein [Sphingomonadales bacterium]|nr:nuclear transport factor 2 family protein [Sphingomonadales bacterium]
MSLLAALVLAASGPAPMALSGGQLDPAYTDADVYRDAPRPPRVPPGPACALADHYVKLVDSGQYAATAALYADDATFLEPMRPGLHGRAEIDAFYARQIGGMKPRLRAVALLGSGRECMVEIAREVVLDGRPRWALVSIDHFLLGADGRISSMIAYARPPRGPLK